MEGVDVGDGDYDGGLNVCVFGMERNAFQGDWMYGVCKSCSSIDEDGRMWIEERFGRSGGYRCEEMFEQMVV